MSEKWFTGCTHFNHAKIMEYCNRPFSSVSEMDECMFDNFNDVVRPEDELFILGDFCFGSIQIVRECVRRLPTKNVYLILGNHDRHTRKKYAEAGFSWVKNYYEVKVPLNNGGKKVTLFHYPMESWNGSFRGSWHLHSHTHNSMPDNPNKLRMNVGVDVTDFKPVNIGDIEEFMGNKSPIFDC